jgi:hypothetical protein
MSLRFAGGDSSDCRTSVSHVVWHGAPFFRTDAISPPIAIQACTKRAPDRFRCCDEVSKADAEQGFSLGPHIPDLAGDGAGYYFATVAAWLSVSAGVGLSVIGLFSEASPRTPSSEIETPEPPNPSSEPRTPNPKTRNANASGLVGTPRPCTSWMPSGHTGI